MAASTSNEILMLGCNTYSGAEIAIFCVDSYLTFQGLVQFKVIAGLTHLYGHTFKPSSVFHDACPLLDWLKMTAVCMDEVETLEHKDYAIAVTPASVMFRQARCVETLGKAVVDPNEEDHTGQSFYVDIELNKSDCIEINKCIQRSSTLNICAIVVFRELRSNTVEILLNCFPFYCLKKQTLPSSSASKRFIKKIKIGDNITNQKFLEIPPALDIPIRSLVHQEDVVLMIMGQANTGKSTLARYTINAMLNRHSRVAFLECDVGQTEFTPTGLVSLTFVSRPLIGPPCTHQQSPERAFLIGDSSPMQQPDLYISSINSLMQYFISQGEEMPLIVNTCGWLKDLGTCIFWDLLRLINPSHVIHLHGDQQDMEFQSYWFREEFVPINTVTCHYSLGWLLAPPSSCDQLHPSELNNQPRPPHSCDYLCPSDTKERSSQVQESLEIIEISTDSEVVSSPTPERSRMDVVNQGKKIKSTHKRSSHKRPFNRRKRISIVQPMFSKRKLAGKKSFHRMKLRDTSKQPLRAPRHAHKQCSSQDTGWRRCGMFRLLSHITNPYVSKSSATVSREISMAMYFAQMNDETIGITPWPELLLAAVPYAIKWHQLAIHCLTVEVPCSQTFYAINGMVVGLTRVDPSIIVDFDDNHLGIIKFLTERTPLAEYKGYGLVRGIDMKEKIFYITTPEPLQRLKQVNCLMLGKNELSSDVYTCSKKLCNGVTQPYVNSDLPKMAILKPFRERAI